MQNDCNECYWHISLRYVHISRARRHAEDENDTLLLTVGFIAHTKYVQRRIRVMWLLHVVIMRFYYFM